MSLLYASKKQGIPAPRTQAERVAYEAEKAERRLRNVVNAREILERNKIEYRESQLPCGDPVFVIDDGGVITYYPADGRWYTSRRTVHFGCRNLVRFVKGSVI